MTKQPVNQWRKLGDGTYMMASNASRALVNIGLVIGSERALLIDTGCGPRHATEILAAVRALTPLPLVIANTHAHWDHFFGNAVFRDERAADDAGIQFWAHASAARDMAETGESQRGEVVGPEPEMAAGIGPGTEIVLPTHLLRHDSMVLELGRISVELFCLGRGHTDGDLMVGAPGVLFAGDVLEEGAAPQFEDSFPSEWAHVLRTLGGMGEQYPVMVPGHGQPVDASFAAELARTVELGPAS
ncbi:MBL fold metallo-hydrolase [Arthrobacter sp. Sr24]